MANWIISKCLICDRSVFSLPSCRRKFCSADCYHEGQRKGLVVHGRPVAARRIHKCSHCGGQTVGNDSRKRDGSKADHAFCSRQCYDAFRAERVKARTRNCDYCGKSFLPWTTTKYRRMYCSDECRKLGLRPPSSKCKVCGVEFTPIRLRNGQATRLRRVVCSPECEAENYRTDPVRKQKISLAFAGDKHPGWQGGSHRDGFRGQGWQKLADIVRARAGFRCEHCGLSQEEHLRRYKMRLNVNHKEPFHQHRSKKAANAVTNLEALCKSCHTKADWKWRKANPMQLSMSWR